MLKKAKSAAKEHGFNNAEFRKGDIENSIPIEDHSVDAVISNCVVNLTTDKVKAFRKVYRILKKGGKGRMIISDLNRLAAIIRTSPNRETAEMVKKITRSPRFDLKGLPELPLSFMVVDGIQVVYDTIN